MATKDGKKTGGKPKGYKAPKTLEKEAAREAVRKRITDRIVPLVDAQIDSAIGIKHFFLRDEQGQWKRISNPAEIEKALNGPREGFFIHTKDPNSIAAREMLDRAIDKPKEQAQDLNVNLTVEQNKLDALYAGRARAAQERKK